MNNKSRNYKVYMHTCIENNKRYIGITCRALQERWGYEGVKYKPQTYFWNAICKYGWNNFKHELIFQNLSREEACIIEKGMIAFYKSSEKDFGYNIMPGGSGYIEWTEKMKEKQRRIRKGVTVSEETKRLISEHHADVSGKNNPMYGVHPWVYNKGKKVICLDNKVIYNTAKEAGEKLNINPNFIRAVACGDEISIKGYHFCYLEDYDENKIYNLGVYGSRPVVCTDTGEIFTSIKECAIKLNVDDSAISKVCRGKAKHVHGYHFKYLENYNNKDNTTQDREKSTREVYCRETRKYYSTIRECAKELDLDPSSISKVCRGKHKSTKGYHIEYVE